MSENGNSDQKSVRDTENEDDTLGDSTTMQTATVGQKRQNDEPGGPASKKPFVGDTKDEVVQVKLLIPSSAVGAIIGKGGEAMRALKTETGCRLQMSKNQEVYHGTSERICLVRGKVASVMKVIEAILEKIREKVDPNTPADMYDHKGTDRTKEMKLLVPNTSAGMVIGKNGASVKEIREQTGASVQIFPKAGSAEAKSSQYRVITLASEDDNVLMDAVFRVLERVAADPQHASPIETNDVDNFSAQRNTSGKTQTIQPFEFSGRQSGGAPFSSAPTSLLQSSVTPLWQAGQSRVVEPAFSSNGDLFSTLLNGLRFNPMQGLGNAEILTFLDSLQATLRTSGFNEGSISEIMQAMQILAKYNIMGLGLGLGAAAIAQLRPSDMSLPVQISPLLDSRAAASNIGNILVDVLNQCKSDTPLSNEPNFASSIIKEIVAEKEHVEIEVPENIVGAILGPKAKTLMEIQHLSGCQLEVHKRGVASGQGNRLVSLSGDPDCIRTCRMMIEKVINDEQVRRNRLGLGHQVRASLVS